MEAAHGELRAKRTEHFPYDPLPARRGLPLSGQLDVPSHR
jgi:hypothetical protein